MTNLTREYQLAGFFDTVTNSLTVVSKWDMYLVIASWRYLSIILEHAARVSLGQEALPFSTGEFWMTHAKKVGKSISLSLRFLKMT